MYLVARCGVLSGLVYFGVLWLLNLVYLLARFGILAAWIWGTWCTWWPEFGILWCFNLVYFVAVLGGFSIYLLAGDLVYAVGILGVCVCVLGVCVLGGCTLWVYLGGCTGVLWLLNLVYLVARFVLIAGWILCTGDTWCTSSEC